MRNRRRNWFLRRLVLGFAVALVVVPAAQARVDGGSGWSGPGQSEAFVAGVTDFPGSSYIAPEQGGLVRGDYKDGVGTSPGTVVIVGDDKHNLPAAPSIVLAGDDKRDIGARPTAGVLVGDDKRGLPQYSQYAYWPIVNTADYAQYSQFAYRRALPEDLGPRAAILAELDAKTREYVAGAAPVVSEPVEVVSSPSSGFDWGDAGIGAGTVFALILLGTGAVLATRHVGRPAQV